MALAKYVKGLRQAAGGDPGAYPLRRLPLIGHEIRTLRPASQPLPQEVAEFPMGVYLPGAFLPDQGGDFIRIGFAGGGDNEDALRQIKGGGRGSVLFAEIKPGVGV